jgi:hypothetical protein
MVQSTADNVAAAAAALTEPRILALQQCGMSRTDAERYVLRLIDAETIGKQAEICLGEIEPIIEKLKQRRGIGGSVRTRDILGRATGRGGRTLDKAISVLGTAKSATERDHLIKELDAGRVDAIYRRILPITVLRAERPALAPALAESEFGAETDRVAAQPPTQCHSQCDQVAKSFGIPGWLVDLVVGLKRELGDLKGECIAAAPGAVQASPEAAGPSQPEVAPTAAVGAR